MKNEIKTTTAFDSEAIGEELLVIDDDVLRRIRRLKIMVETNRAAADVEVIRLAYWNIDCKSPYKGLDNVKALLKKLAGMSNDISKEIISISDDIEKLKTIISKINEYCG